MTQNRIPIRKFFGSEVDVLAAKTQYAVVSAVVYQVRAPAEMLVMAENQAFVAHNG